MYFEVDIRSFLSTWDKDNIKDVLNFIVLHNKTGKEIADAIIAISDKVKRENEFWFWCELTRELKLFEEFSKVRYTDDNGEDVHYTLYFRTINLGTYDDLFFELKLAGKSELMDYLRKGEDDNV